MSFKFIKKYSYILYMPLYTFKVIDNTNNYYLYILSRFNDPELALKHVEYASGAHPEDPIHNYFNFIGWDSISIAPAENIKPTDVVIHCLLMINV